MAKYTGAKCRLCRREGCKLFLKGDKCYKTSCPFEKRPVAPEIGRASCRERV